jgi:hypothetical protein
MSVSRCWNAQEGNHNESSHGIRKYRRSLTALSRLHLYYLTAPHALSHPSAAATMESNILSTGINLQGNDAQEISH